MNNISYIQAKVADIPALIDARITFLIATSGEQTAEGISALKKNLESYFAHAIPHGEYICWLAKADDTIVGTGAMTIRYHPGTFNNPTGVRGYIMGMYTAPAFRRQGISATLLNKLMEIGNKLGVTTFELYATKEGAFVYEKAGFSLHHEPAYFKYGADITKSKASE